MCLQHFQGSIYPPLPPLATQENIDLYTFLFEHPNPYDNPNETTRSPVLTDPAPTALHDTGGLEELNWTLPDLKKRVELCGRALRNEKWGLEVGKGDVVGILGWDGIGFATVEYSTFWAYGIVSFMCPTWKQEQVYHQMKEAQTKVLAIHSSLLFSLGLPTARRLQIPLEKIILLDESPPPSDFLDHEIQEFKDHHFFTIEELYSMQEGEERNTSKKKKRQTKEEVGFDCEKDVALLCCTSGTTGPPKAVMLSHRNVVSNILQSCGRPGDESEEACLRGKRYISIPPWIHQGGQSYGLLVALYKRIHNIILERVDVEKFLELAKRRLDPAVFKDARSALLAGATVPEATIRSWRKHFPNIPIREAMGATEATAMIMCQDFFSWKRNKGSCGKLVKGMKSMLLPISPPGSGDQGVITEDMIITQDDTPGELFCTGPNIMLGYLKEEKKTKEALIDWGGEKWYKTGDLVLTRNGGVDFWHLARIKDLIWFKDEKGGGEYSVGKSKGYTCVRPLVIENVLGKHEAVRECAVVGVEDERWGSVPKAFVVLQEGEWEDEEVREELIRFSDLRAEEEYLHLKGGLEFVKQLPKNIAGKVLRNQLLRDNEPK
ncbi:acetyl-CoA synthetase-like protein [Terfezia boudieri ATCC MYA-4762]|uniref:Acetyl-CoA synthetase-like protein n=1 Tax=Terfezia boudieri ATCC MYA-4762 TaxID=1051890 RepID=A0A3N4LRP3_9PEZI|nr:acetyl-CoA synthetase-like protein [Terfezia boudieri ATCC MYA-4762]